MASFRYEAYDAAGARRGGYVDFANREAALAFLAGQGLHVFSLEAGHTTTKEPWWRREILTSSGMRASERLVFTRELAAMLKAQLPIDEALGVVQLQPGLPRGVREMTSRLLENVRQGRSLSQALAEEETAFPEFYWRLVRSGETSGSVADAVAALASYLERGAQIRSRVTSALVYPMLLVLVAVIAIVVLMFVLLPAIMPLFQDAGVVAPMALRVTQATRNFVVDHWLVACVGLLSLIFLSLWLGRTTSVRRTLDRVMLRIPLLGRAIKTSETGRFSRVLATQIKNGVPLIDALKATEGVMANLIYKDAVDGITRSVSEGSALSHELKTTLLFTDLAARLVAVGERTGQLEAMLERSAAVHEATLEREVDRMTALLGPLLTLGVGGFVGALMLSVMQAILSINDLALR
ncbi:MAG: type II secretion system F family protein [Hyphomicrobiaceae bacterium]